MKNYYKENKEKILEVIKNYYIKFPYRKTLNNIKQRCNNPNSTKYEYYGGRGIKCLISKKELEKLWFRDKAYLMKQPSIDRIKEDRHYELNNCRFIEMEDNRIRANSK